MRNYITVDGGTTNTRIALISDNMILGAKCLDIGAKKNINGIMPLKIGIEGAIKTLLSEHGLIQSDIIQVLASGMITSEFGLCELPHISVPAGIKELHANMFEVLMPDICSIPFVFIRGVKTNTADLARLDMMRGEETELFGLTGEIEMGCAYVLPGSHSKIILTDENGKIADFSTMLT